MNIKKSQLRLIIYSLSNPNQKAIIANAITTIPTIKNFFKTDTSLSMSNLLDFVGFPQLGQVLAWSDISLPHSLHFTSAIVTPPICDNYTVYVKICKEKKKGK